jgi:hypothetical protein
MRIADGAANTVDLAHVRHEDQHDGGDDKGRECGEPEDSHEYPTEQNPLGPPSIARAT